MSAELHPEPRQAFGVPVPAGHDHYPDELIGAILHNVRTIALVGASANPARPSWIVAKYLGQRGYDVWLVNPGLAGEDLLGKRVVARLADLPVPIDLVEIFRNSEAAAGITDEALALVPRPKVIWMQLSVRNDAAAVRAEAAGATVIMNRCPKIEYGRLSGEISWNGVNSRTLSSKRRTLAGTGTQKLALPVNRLRPPRPV
ncbi:CoA-binding protein [Chelatococcus reniformis]|uniref:CoA-binding protein n=1 Tax=Chelatococcus reniformis TaxID=1494448 RepID=UPI00166641F4|nr:CoA-binding protein [Chelatococcus reniformis]